MKKFSLAAFLALIVCAFSGKAQIITTSPSPLQEDSQDVTIYYHANLGNKGLMGVKPPTKVYAHTGVMIEGNDEWQHAPTWGDNSDKYELTWVSDNLWELYIGNIREYYNVKPDETVTKLAFVFRTADKSKEGKGDGNSDIFVDVVDSGLQLAIQSGLTGGIVTPENNKVTFNVSATMDADLTLSVNGEQIGSANNTQLLTVDYTFNEPGDYAVTATATAPGYEPVTLTQNYCYASASQEMAYPGELKMGPVKNADGSVTFCIAAPEKESVIIVGAWNDYQISNEHVMNYTDVDGFRYFWVTIDGLDNETQYGYYFLVDGNIKVGDPYARLVLDPWYDKYLGTDVYPDLPAYPFDKVENVSLAIYQGNINDYDWQVKNFQLPDPSNLIIYEMLFRDFTGTEGKAEGNGTVQQAIEKFDYLKTLGVNVIELLPINQFNGNISWGYNPNFYFAPDKAYGTPDDYKEFIDLCHQNGMAVVLDMVFNQSDWQHPWYQMYGGTVNSPFYNATAPHAYSVLNDWNQGYPLVQQQWADVLEYWLTEYNVDGFRFDLVKGLGLNDSYANNGDAATNAYNKSRVEEMAYLNSIIQSVKPGAYCINENLAGQQEENEMARDGELNWANVNNEGCQFAMGYSSDSNLNRLYAPRDSNRIWGSTVSYLESHDEQRLAYKQDTYGEKGVKGDTKVSMQRLGSAAAQMIMTPGAHMIWQFSEMGNAQNTKNSDGGNNTDPKIVNWNLLENEYHKGLYDNYCELINVRMTYPAMFCQDAVFNINCAASNWANGRSLVSAYAGKELFTFVNPNITGSLTMNVNFESKNDADYEILTCSYGSEPSFSASAGTVTIPANCYVVIGSTDLPMAGIGSLVSDDVKSLKAHGGYGEVVVENAAGTAMVYSLDGQAIGVVKESGSVSAVPGVYIVKSGKDSVKVVVK